MAQHSVTIHVRIPRRLKEELDRLGINVSEEVRRLLERRVRAERLRRLLEETEQHPIHVSHDTTRLIRADRDQR